jgi:predicted enzyme related to lactoylglutathione lyase
VLGTSLRERTFLQQMNLQMSYTILRSDDIAAAERWYSKLLGRDPDNRPMKTLVQWNLSAQHGVGLSSDELICGNGSAIFLIVDDLAAERRRLQNLGITLGEDMPGDYSTLAQVRDPDGNLLTLATPPSPPYPPA